MKTITIWLKEHEFSVLQKIIQDYASMYGCTLSSQQAFPSCDYRLYNVLCIDEQSAFSLGCLVERHIICLRNVGNY